MYFNTFFSTLFIQPWPFTHAFIIRTFKLCGKDRYDTQQQSSMICFPINNTYFADGDDYKETISNNPNFTQNMTSNAVNWLILKK